MVVSIIIMHPDMWQKGERGKNFSIGGLVLPGIAKKVGDFN